MSPLAQGVVKACLTIIQKLAEKYQKHRHKLCYVGIWRYGLVVIPKSVTPSRIEENFHIFDFKLEKKKLLK